jgi:hypothetical protein
MNQENRDLRSFGLILAVVIGLLWLLFHPGLAWQWLAGTEFIVVLAALLVPVILKPVHWLLSKLSMAISKVLNPLILAVVFYLVVTPMGVVMRLFGYDPMAMKRKADNGSFRKTVDKHTTEHFDRPF